MSGDVLAMKSRTCDPTRKKNTRCIDERIFGGVSPKFDRIFSDAYRGRFGD